MQELDRPSEGSIILQEGESVPSTDPSQPPENPLLVRYRGHRTRTWGDAEALEALALIANGHSAVKALETAGIPYGAHEHPVLAAAIREVYAHEGAAHFEELARLGAQGLHSHKAASYVRMMLELHGRLKDREPGAGAQAQPLVLHIHVQGQPSPVVIEAQARTIPGPGAP